MKYPTHKWEIAIFRKGTACGFKISRESLPRTWKAVKEKAGANYLKGISATGGSFGEDLTASFEQAYTCARSNIFHKDKINYVEHTEGDARVTIRRLK